MRLKNRKSAIIKGERFVKLKMRSMRLTIFPVLELGILFLPAIPAYLWMWPAAERLGVVDIVQSFVYVYILTGTLFIGLRRWSLRELGVNQHGMFLGLGLGIVLVIERLLAQLSLGLPLDIKAFEPIRLVWEVFFYFVLVGFVEELLFRGLIYHLIDNWRGAIFAIIGQAIAFAVWHVAWAGPLAIAHFVLGILFGFTRQRAGGILGLALGHGLFDLVWMNIQPEINLAMFQQISAIQFPNRLPLILGDFLLLAWCMLLWRIRPSGVG